jgi:hypothetical protein
MTEHLADIVAYVSGEDDSELGRTKAELAYALHSLEREIAIAHSMQRQNESLATALEECVTILDGAQSGFIPGCGSDLAWRRGRDDRVDEARRLIAAVKGAPDHG